MRVAILLFQGVEELDSVGVYEVLAKARLYGCNVEVRSDKEMLIWFYLGATKDGRKKERA